MAKKEPTIEDAASTFLDVVKRCQFDNFVRNDRMLYTNNKKNMKTFILVEEKLWQTLSEDQEFIESTRELSPTVSIDRFIINNMSLLNNNNIWIDIDDEKMANSDKIEVNLEGFQYAIEFNKSIWPLRFKKSEFGYFSYAIITKPFYAFVIRKKVETNIEDGSFYLMRMFSVI